MATYKMIQIPPNISVAAKGLLGKAPDPSQVAAQYLELTVNKMAADGWAFHRVDAIGVSTTPGCLAGLFGQKGTEATYYVVTFRKE